MKMKIYSVLISVFLLMSFSSFAATEAGTVKAEKVSKSNSQSVTGKKASEYFFVKSSVYNKSGRVKRKGSKKSCPAFEM